MNARCVTTTTYINCSTSARREERIAAIAKDGAKHSLTFGLSFENEQMVRIILILKLFSVPLSPPAGSGLLPVPAGFSFLPSFPYYSTSLSPLLFSSSVSFHNVTTLFTHAPSNNDETHVRSPANRSHPSPVFFPSLSLRAYLYPTRALCTVGSICVRRVSTRAIVRVCSSLLCLSLSSSNAFLSNQDNKRSLSLSLSLSLFLSSPLVRYTEPIQP